MAVREYIGARYVPLFADTLWTDTIAYEPLTIVLHEGNSYTSRQFVPIGIDISNGEFWAITGNYNAQVEAYRKEVATLGTKYDKLLGKTSVYTTPEEFGAVGDGVTDDTNAFVKAFSTGLPVILSPKTYVVGTLTLPKGINMEGAGGGLLYKAPSTKTVLKAVKIISNYENEGGVLKGIEFQAPIDTLYSFVIDGCTFNGPSSGIATLRNSTVVNSAFNSCTSGISTVIDSIITNCMFNECGTGLIIPTGSDTVISECKIQWCNLGISLNGGLKVLVFNNIFDANNVSIDITAGGTFLIAANLFTRSINYHMTGNFSGLILDGCIFSTANSKDDGSGTIVPAYPFNFSTYYSGNMSNCHISIPAGGKLNYTSPAQTGITFDNVYINGINVTRLHGYRNVSSPGASVNNPFNSVMPFNGLNYFFTDSAIAILESGTQKTTVQCNLNGNNYTYSVPTAYQTLNYKETIIADTRGIYNLVVPVSA